MNLLKAPLRRTTAAVAGAFIGLAGVAVFAAPAAATHPTVSGEATCLENGKWEVTWTVSNEWPNKGIVKSVDVQLPQGGSLVAGGQIVVGAELKHKRFNEVLVSKQVLDADDAAAKLRVGVLFDNGHREGDEDKVLRPEECKTPPSTPPSSAPPSTPPSSAPPSTPPSSTPPSTPPSSPAPGEPTPIIEMDCDSITFGLDNPADGDEVKVIITTSKGESRELTVAPGEKKTEKFSATPGFVLTLKDVASGESVELPYTQPEDCESAGSGGGDGELPLTGAAAGGIAGGAALLLAAGGALFVMARRRKLKFTA